MGKIRVYELSKELGIPNKDVLNIASELNIDASSHVSTLSESEANKIRSKSKGAISTGSEGDVGKTPEDNEDNKEEVKIFTSDSGQEIVERRKGRNVIIRRKKGRRIKVEEQSGELPEAPRETELTSDKVAEDSGEGKAVDEAAGAKTTGEKPGESAETVPETENPEQAAETVKPEDEGEIRKRKRKGKKRTVEDDEVETPEGLTDIRAKKKIKKSKPKKDDFIDPEVLEDLKRAFRTKLPSRKREYVVQDKKNRGKGTPGKRSQRSQGRQRGYDKKDYDRGRSGSGYDQQQSDAQHQDTTPAKRTIKIGESVTVGELAKKMQLKAGDVIKKMMQMGLKATINESLDDETATLVADELGFEVKVEKFEEKDILLEKNDDVDAELLPRPPVVTVMGHVDHGKTTLLDTIRKTNVVGGEAGGITQHIGAYRVNHNDSTIVFIDTPGHEAFTSMRARGASITDIVILVVAADDGVMPQTIEAINHSKAAGVPIIVAINKVDKPGAEPDKIKRELSEAGLLPEEWGGDTLIAEVSAKSGQGIDHLLELVTLQSDLMELKAAADKRANGVVIEAELDTGRGAVATVLVVEGTLRVGDYLVIGTEYSRVRALTDDQGNRIKEAGPSTPVEIMGLSVVPEAGEKFYVVKNEKAAKEVVSHREDAQRQKTKRPDVKITLEDLYESIDSKEIKELNLIIKADMQGSVEALKESLNDLSTDKCRVNIVHTGVGAISETDVALASASNAIIVGFNVRPDKNAKNIAEKEGVSFELHSIIYDVVDRVKNAMEGLLEPIVKESVTGYLEVRDTFKISKQGTIAGCMVTEGKVTRDNNIRVIRDGVVIYDGKIESLKRFKDDVKEVQSGYECGISIQNFNDIKVGDTFEVYEYQQIKQEL